MAICSFFYFEFHKTLEKSGADFSAAAQSPRAKIFCLLLPIDRSRHKYLHQQVLEPFGNFEADAFLVTSYINSE